MIDAATLAGLKAKMREEYCKELTRNSNSWTHEERALLESGFSHGVDWVFKTLATAGLEITK